MTHDEMIAVIKAHKEGKQIQHSFVHEDEWYDCIDNSWNFADFKYRVKPSATYQYVLQDIDSGEIVLSKHHYSEQPDLGNHKVICRADWTRK